MTSHPSTISLICKPTNEMTDGIITRYQVWDKILRSTLISPASTVLKKAVSRKGQLESKENGQPRTPKGCISPDTKTERSPKRYEKIFVRFGEVQQLLKIWPEHADYKDPKENYTDTGPKTFPLVAQKAHLILHGVEGQQDPEG
jgi:hypothetical protein